MANHQPARLRLRPSEHRLLLFVGDLLMSIVSVFAAAYTFQEYRRYLLKADGFGPRVIEQLLRNDFTPFWFYLLPLVWLLLMTLCFLLIFLVDFLQSLQARFPRRRF